LVAARLGDNELAAILFKGGNRAMKKLLLVLAALFMWPAIAFANANDDHMGDWGNMMGGGMFMWIVFLVVIVVAVLVITQGTRWTSSGRAPQETSLDLLKKRYAKGEITREEFERMKEDLKT